MTRYSPMTVLALAATLAGCADRRPSEPEAAPVESGVPNGADSLIATRASLAAALEDATTRVVPALSDRGRAELLERALVRLADAVARQPQQVARAAALARAELDFYAADADADAANGPTLAAIRLVLDRIDPSGTR